MSSKTKTTATTNEAVTPALEPKLRFPEFRKADGWIIGKVDELVDTITPPKKLPTSNYAATGAFPIIDQSQSEICGWTDDNDALIQDDLPLIVFGDHTCILKLIDRPFAQGADGIKILKSRPKIGTTFLYQFLSYRPVVTEEYKRHYSILKEKAVFFPEFKTGEQQKIAACLSSVDELIAAQSRKLDALKTHKKGLMQQLFPRESETQPRLRFPEFQNTGEWKPTSFGGLRLDVSDGNYSSKYPSQSDFVANGVPFLRANNLKFGTVSDDDMRFISKEQHSQITKGHLKQGDILITTRGELGTVALVPDRHIGSNINAQIVRINSGNILVNTFLFQLLDYSRVTGLFEALSTGTALKQLPIGKLNQLALRIPELREEQKRIADCLGSLDDLIAARTQTLEALKTHKQGLMQQLFPSPEFEV